MSDTPVSAPTPSFREILAEASASAVRGGTAGAVAMGANVVCLMWMRTTVRSHLLVVHGIRFFVMTINE